MDASGRTERSARNGPLSVIASEGVKKVSETSLWNAALFYLQRYSATEAQLRRVLVRKVKRAAAKTEQDVSLAGEWIDSTLSRLKSLGYLHDEQVATSRVSMWRRAGKSRQAIAAKLQLQGVPSTLISEATAKNETTDEEAIWILAKRKKLGPYRSPEKRADFRKKDLAALARAGFSFSLAMRVVDAVQVPETGSEFSR